MCFRAGVENLRAQSVFKPWSNSCSSALQPEKTPQKKTLKNSCDFKTFQLQNKRHVQLSTVYEQGKYVLGRPLQASLDTVANPHKVQQVKIN